MNRTTSFIVNAVLIQMGSDERIPANAMGYVADLQRQDLSESVRRDRLNMLSRYVPELVREYIAATDEN